MEVVKVLRMNEGMGEYSYAMNSLYQKKVISMAMPITEEAMTNLFSKNNILTSLSIADLGCSSGPNSLFIVFELVKIVEKICRQLDRKSPEYQVFLNDLPSNDFNNIFMSLPSFHDKLKKQMGATTGPCFVTGVPGSFYGRLFPSKSLHFVHSSCSVQWLSQVPDGLEGNKCNIFMAGTSPPSVLKAYYMQFRRDFSEFLRCRSEELVAGGKMVLTFTGRRSEDASSKDCCCIWELMAMALHEMVLEGMIEEEKLNSFNVPYYTPSPLEVKMEVEKEGSFCLEHLEVTEVNWDPYANENNLPDDLKDGGYNVAKWMRAATEPLLQSHFGESIIDEVFFRYKRIISDRIGKERTEFDNVIVSVTKRG